MIVREPYRHLPRWELACAHLALVVPFVLAMTVVPESPHWLLMRGNEWAGEQALKWLRGR